jgi:hypothetical protein
MNPFSYRYTELKQQEREARYMKQNHITAASETKWAQPTQL